ncbi:MAG: ATP-binding cassette domain-containing protein [Candidatus Bipolaricaulota bacterium]|nr:ATP-binding cassette domain-containing protein [Candidatus Bipolaricaulota bacterium]MDW8127397.1 ATP-binding cassette domain-containing protein [Candidatus Bipolaricaulota bacterium]
MRDGKLLQMVNISKYFGRVQALVGVDFDVDYEEIVGLLGDNGAGKSTLVKIITGVFPPDSGEMYFEGQRVHLRSPRDAQRLGIEAVYQEATLVNVMNIARNFFLGREPTRWGFLLDKRRMNRESVEVLSRIGVNICSPRREVSLLSGGERQSICIGRALYFQAKLVIFDEPTAALSVKETEYVLRYIRSLKEKGISVVVITHNIYHIYDIADRFVILDRGHKIGEFTKSEVTPQEIVEVIRSGATVNSKGREGG